jgi:hypothetical protein
MTEQHSEPVCYKDEHGNVMFHCPACGCLHAVATNPGQPNATGSLWTWNNDLVRPTFQPSIFVRMRLTANPKRPNAKPDIVCHSFIRNGCIEFCSDSTHAFAGATLPLDPWFR